MAYEQKMSVDHDAITKKVTVYFRGKKIVLPGRYDSQEDGMWAGEKYCRDHGWEG